MKPHCLAFFLLGLSIQGINAQENICVDQIDHAVHAIAIQYTDSHLKSQQEIENAYQVFNDDLHQATVEYCQKVNQWKNRTTHFPTQNNQQLEYGYSNSTIECANKIQTSAVQKTIQNGLSGGLAEDYAYQRATEQSFFILVKSAALKLCQALGH